MDKLPEEAILTVVSYITAYQDLVRCSMVCKRWKTLLDSFSDVWLQILDKEVPEKFVSDPFVQKLESPKAKLVAYFCSWSETDHSKNIKLKPNLLTLHREPIAQSTDAIRGKRGFYVGQHYWMITWHGPSFGSNAVIGVATQEASLHGKGYYSLLGSDDQSWGWDISQNQLQHAGEIIREYPKAKSIKVSPINNWRACRAFMKEGSLAKFCV